MVQPGSEDFQALELVLSQYAGAAEAHRDGPPGILTEGPRASLDGLMRGYTGGYDVSGVMDLGCEFEGK
jgi:hypothetical protein